MENTIEKKNGQMPALEPYKQHHLWHTGNVVKIKYKDVDVFIAALGLADISIVSKVTGEEVLNVNNLSNKEEVSNQLSRVIKNDKELESLINGEHPRYQLGESSVENYWECYFGYNDKLFPISWKLSMSTITKAMAEVSREISNKYNAFKLENFSLGIN